MDDQRVGAIFRAVRVRLRWRQKDVARKAKVSPSMVSLVERGHLDRVSLRALRRVATVLDIRLDVLARWRGGELDRLLNWRHAALSEAVTGWLGSDQAGWSVVPEVSFAIYGERGSIDLLAWHAPTGTLLVIELKTEIVDVQELIGVMDRKRRLASRIGRERGWLAQNVAAWVFVAEGPTNRRRVQKHSATLRAAFPADGRALTHWLRDPHGSVYGLSFFSYATRDRAKREAIGPKRVRLPRCAAA